MEHRKPVRNKHTSIITHTLRITLQHAVHFTDHVFGRHNPTLRQVIGSLGHTPAKTLVVADNNLLRSRPSLIHEVQSYLQQCPETAILIKDPVTIPGGEAAKNSVRHVTAVLNAVAGYDVCRHSVVLIIGGGAVLDAAGFACAIAHRGIRHIRIPTTTLSQNDAGVGLKNGVNMFGRKNFLGVFAPPNAVINDYTLLSTLSKRAKRSGIAEAVKVALIQDAGFFGELEAMADGLRDLEEESMRRMIVRCAALHLDHIVRTGDPFETGNGRPLDFGHWCAHRLESLSSYRLLHGEAVAIGMAIDVLYSQKTMGLSRTSAGRILHLLRHVGLPLYAQELSDTDPRGRFMIFAGLEEFRQHLGGRLRIPLLKSIGHAEDTHEMRLEILQDCIAMLKASA